MAAAHQTISTSVGPDALRVQALHDGTSPAQQDIAIRRGSARDYAAVILQILQADGVTPVPLDDATVTLTIALACGSVLAKSTKDGTMTLDLATSTVTWLPSVAETLSIAPGRINTYELILAFSSGSIGPYMTGFIVGLDRGDPQPSGVYATGQSASSTVRVIKVLVPGTPGVSGSGESRFSIVVMDQGDVDVPATGGFVGINKTVPSETTVLLPDDAVDGCNVIVKDMAGNASRFPITVTGSVTIDGRPDYKILVDGEGITFHRNKVEWSLI